MNAEDMILVSVDDHTVEPPDMFAHHVPDEYRDRARHMTKRPDGTDVWIYDDNEIPNIGLNAVAGRPPEEYNIEPTRLDEIRKGCYDIHERVNDMNRNGVLGSMCFPSFVQFCGQLFSRSKDPDVGLVMLKAYNDWHVEEWCGTYPGRFIPLSIPPIWDPVEMAAEVRRMAAKGCHAVTSCADEGTVICLHIGSSSTMLGLEPGAPIDCLITMTPLNAMSAATDLLWSPVLRKFPTLQFALSEGSIGWLPYWLERIDYVYQQHRFWTHQDFGDRLPSQVARDHFTFCFISDPAGVDARTRIGIDNITWECDYPHSDSSWPHSPESVLKQIDGTNISDADLNKITHENAMRIFRFDPFSVRRREESTVGALRALAGN